jgi:hypothetical protein
MRHRLFCLLTVIWVGSLLSVGYLVAPTLFTVLDRNAAGNAAASLFRSEAIIGVVCGVVLLVIGNALVKQGASAYRRSRWLVLGMLLCVLVGYFAVEPFMDTLRLAAQQAGTDVGNSPYATRFGILHGVSSLLYLVESVFGLMLVWRLPAFARA